jgi:hypothetical protein
MRLIEVKPTPAQKRKATIMAKDMGQLRGSMTKGEGNKAGFIGEICAGQYLNAEHKNTYQYDLILPDGHTVDVKTKRCKFKPLMTYDVSISTWNTKQACDYYVFARTLNDYSLVWLLGYMDKEQYFDEAVFKKKGTREGFFTFNSDCWNMAIKDLKPIKDLLNK